MKIVEIRNQSNPEAIVKVKYCSSFLSKLIGLMFRKDLGRNEGIVLVEEHESRINTSIHMFFMRIDIAVFWLDKEFFVVDKVLARKWRPAYVPKHPAQYVLELHHSKIYEFSIGDQVTINFPDE
jgi:uncharacterized membrane protein (UPF0127 family)